MHVSKQAMFWIRLLSFLLEQRHTITSALGLKLSVPD